MKRRTKNKIKRAVTCTFLLVIITFLWVELFISALERSPINASRGMERTPFGETSIQLVLSVLGR